MLISRRGLVAGAAASAFPLSGASAERLDIYEIVDELSFGLSDALDQYQGGRFCALIFPSAGLTHPVSYHRVGSTIDDIDRYARMMSVMMAKVRNQDLAMVSVLPAPADRPVQFVYRD